MLIGPLLLVNWSEENGPAALLLASADEAEGLLESALATDWWVGGRPGCVDLDLTL